MTCRLIGSRARPGWVTCRRTGPLYPDEKSSKPAELLRRRPRAVVRQEARAESTRSSSLCALRSVIGKPIGKLSRGYRQRVGMAQVLLHEPDVLILDEPTAGLDPNQIHEVRETIRKLGQNKTILLSTHILQEVEAMANRALFIDEGKIMFRRTGRRTDRRRQAAGRPVPRADRRRVRSRSHRLRAAATPRIVSPARDCVLFRDIKRLTLVHAIEL